MQTMPAVQVEVTLELKDILHFHFFQLLRKRLLLLTILWLLLTMSFINVNGELWDIMNFWPVLGVAFVWIALIVVFPYFSARRQLATNRFLRDPLSYRFDEDGFALTSPRMTANLQWSGYREIRETRTLFLLFQSNRVATILPKRCFNDPGVITAWKDLARTAMRPPQRFCEPGLIGRIV